MKAMRAASRSGAWSLLENGNVLVASVTLDPQDFTLKVVAAADRDSTTFDSGAGILVLDTRADPELISEGLARDFVRLVQQSRKSAALNVTDRIVVRANLPPELVAAVTRFGDFVRKETLANELLLCAAPLAPPAFEYELDGESKVRIAVAPLASFPSAAAADPEA